MRERGILFSAPMVRALLAGRKSQTRRLFKYPPAVIKRGVDPRMNGWMANRYTKGSGQYPGGNPEYTGDQPPGVLVTCVDHSCQRVPCPYGVPGDRLWVRETWRADAAWDAVRPGVIPRRSAVWYEAGGDRHVVAPGDQRSDRARPSIFLPRWASRITLEVTEVRVERLQDISEEDARAEGIHQFHPLPGGGLLFGFDPKGTPGPLVGGTAVEAYGLLWDAINGAGSWEASPWVWVVSFRWVQP